MGKSINLAILTFLATLLCVLISCREDFEYKTFNGNLEFSKDTVFLDTVFSNIGSSTYSLKVYNPTNEDLLIPSIVLKEGASSSYRVNVDGMPGTSFNDIPILAKDSLLIYIETTFDIGTTGLNEFLLTDAIVFKNEKISQQIPLVSLVKDAVFLYPTAENEVSLTIEDENGEDTTINGFYLTEANLNFSNTLPYVIYGYAVVPENSTLQIETGTKVHFHNNSGIYVATNGSLQINGSTSENLQTLENQVVFEGDRLEPDFSAISGQWGGIIIEGGETENVFTHLTLINSENGIRSIGKSSTPYIKLENCSIYNNLKANLTVANTNLKAVNTIFGNAGSNSVRIENGGNYKFIHCTIANFWSNGFRSAPTLSITNLNDTNTSNTSAAFTNCIITGNRINEFELALSNNSEFNLSFENCLLKIRTEDFAEDPLYDFDNSEIFSNAIFNGNLFFTDPLENNFQIEAESEAIDAGLILEDEKYQFDIYGNLRSIPPDIGAFEYLLN